MGLHDEDYDGRILGELTLCIEVRISIYKWGVLIFYTETIHYNKESNCAEMIDESHRKSQSRLVSSFPIFKKSEQNIISPDTDFIIS